MDVSIRLTLPYAGERHTETHSTGRFPARLSTVLTCFFIAHGLGESLVPSATTHTLALRPAPRRLTPVGVFLPTWASTVIRRKSERRLALMADEEPTVRESPSTKSTPLGAGAADTAAGPSIGMANAPTTAPAASTRTRTTIVPLS